MSFIALTVSETVGSSSSSGLHFTCGSLLIASSLRDDGQLRTPVHLFRIASLSVNRLVPYALKSGVVLHILSVCKGLDFISPFAQPGVLHVSEPSLYCLAYV